MKAIFVDVDGTLTNGLSAWERVHHHFGVEEEMEKHSVLFYSGKIDYDEWARIDVNLWKGKPYSELVHALTNSIDKSLIEGAAEGVKKLKDNGFDIILISGGIDEFAKKVGEIVGANLVISNSIDQSKGIINGLVTIRVSYSKANVVDKIALEWGYDLNKCAAIGDNTNDIDMFNKVRYSLALNSSHESVNKAATSSISTKDFKEAAELLLSIIH